MGEPYRDIFQQGGQTFQVAGSIDIDADDSTNIMRATRDFTLPPGNVYYSTGVRQESTAFHLSLPPDSALLAGASTAAFSSIHAEVLERVVDGDDAGSDVTMNDVDVKDTVKVMDGSTPKVVAKSTLATTVSDELTHTKPRQFTKVCSWLVFTSVEGVGTYKFKYRKADVLGWGARARTE